MFVYICVNIVSDDLCACWRSGGCVSSVYEDCRRQDWKIVCVPCGVSVNGNR